MKWWIVGLVLLAVLAGCSRNTPSSTTSAPKSLVLAKSTAVSLVLLRQISAGSTREGTLVPFMVAEDVADSSGNVLIPKGTIAEGEVTWSRSEGTLGGLTNRPARLAVAIKRTRGAGGESVHLVTDIEKPDEPYAFTRANTGLPDAQISAEGVAKLSGEEVSRKVQEKIEEFFETGDPRSLREDDEVRQMLSDLTKANDMSAAADMMDGSEKLGDIERLVKHVRDGSMTSLAGPQALLAVTALQEMGQLAQSVEHAISSRLKGRTIKAYVGTPVRAFVASDVSVKVKPTS